MTAVKKMVQLTDNSSGKADRKVIREDEFLCGNDLNGVLQAAAVRSRQNTLAEIQDLFREKKWKDMLAIFYPVTEKCPELSASKLDVPIREKLGFALGQLSRFDEAIAELEICVQRQPNNFYPVNSLAYTAYNSLYAAKNREIFLSGKPRADRIKLAHRYFQEAQKLRPDGVTNYYREGMLFKQIEDKPRKALPLFRRAVENWERLDADEQETRHQERKNYIKSLYQLASALLADDEAEKALKYIKSCLAEDETSNHLSLVYKYFALGKVLFTMNRFNKARDALLFAGQTPKNGPADFVQELLARTFLALGNPGKALSIISRIPEKRRRPYIAWTEADIRCQLQDYKGAVGILINSSEKDHRSRHKSLIRLAKIAYLYQDYPQTVQYAAQAAVFVEQTWGNLYGDGLFWQALGALRHGDIHKAREKVKELEKFQPGYPKLNLLMQKISQTR